ncbi:ABC transporter substrate-binding protein [Metabacillus litoralis]|uniref:ABC transporter substrate-binding protein n=1 Tax=Metabacillus litoralis TaxID=152268 RepID=UPI00203B4CE2|nr:ABC transporter substrate-binding protein [Metabacillus litoralis]MCM3409519.1 ABC transporter substrate-binding protein [Metabacillus litoralis]
MKKLLFLMIVTVLALFGCSNSETTSEPASSNDSGADTNETSTSETIKVGALYNVTGGQASLDEPSLAGFQLAAEEINANGGINGKQIEVVSIDSKSDPSTATNGVQELIEVEKVVAISGFSDTTFALTAGPLAQEAGIPFVTSGATSPLIPDQVGDFMFMAAFGDNVQSAAIADYSVNELGAKSAWILTDTSSDFTLGLAKYFKDRFNSIGGKVVLEDEYDGAADVDFSAQITRLKELKEQPDVLMVSAQPDKAGIVVKQIRDMGITTPIVSGDGFDTPQLIEMGGVPQSNDVYFATHVSLENPEEIVQNFVKAYEEKTGNYPENGFAALGYDAMYLIADAIERAGSEDPQAIRDALAETDALKLVTGEVTYGDSHVPTKSVTILGVEDGKFVFKDTVLPE